MKAVVLSGGKGSRISPFGQKRQKCCIPVGNKPNVLRIIEQLTALGITDITIVTGYMEEDVRYCLRNVPGLAFVRSDNLRAALGDLASGTEEDFLLYHGDIYANAEDVEKVINTPNSILVQRKNDDFQLEDYICADVTEYRVRGIWGHPRGHYANARCCGVYRLAAMAVRRAAWAPAGFLQVPCGGMPDDGFHTEQLLQMAIDEGEELCPVIAEHVAVDIDFPWDILFANEAYCREQAASITGVTLAECAHISEKAEVRGGVVLGENSRIGSAILEGSCIIGRDVVIDNGAIIGENCVIGDGTRITDYCKISPNTVIGCKNKIGFTAEVSGVTFDGVAAVHGCEIYGVMGRSVDIAAGCTMGILRFDDRQCSMTVGKKRYSNRFTNGIFLGDYTRTGVNNVFNPGVVVGSNCALGAGLLVTQDLPGGTLVMPEQATSTRDWGPERYGW